MSFKAAICAANIICNAFVRRIVKNQAMNIGKALSGMAVKLRTRSSAVSSVLGKSLRNVNNLTMTAEKRVSDITIVGSLHLSRVPAPVDHGLTKHGGHGKRNGKPRHESRRIADWTRGETRAAMRARIGLCSVHKTRPAPVNEPMVAERKNNFIVSEQRPCAPGEEVIGPAIVIVQEGNNIGVGPQDTGIGIHCDAKPGWIHGVQYALVVKTLAEPPSLLQSSIVADQ